MNSFILGVCDKSYFVEIFLIVKTIFKIACYIAPLIIIIISMIHIFKSVMNGKEEDLKEALKVTVKRIIAGLLIAFLPALINYVFTDVIDSSNVEFLACFESASKEKVQALKAKEEKEAEEERKKQAKEDEKKLKEAYEKEKAEKEKQKEKYEEWKKTHGANGKIAELAVFLSPTATPEGHLEQPDGNPWRQIPDSRLNNHYKIMDATIGKYGDNNAYASCAQAAAGVIRATVDPDFNTANPRGQIEYLRNNPKWELVTVVKANDNVDEICQPGDVLITPQGSSGHTMIYVGNELVRKKFPNSDGNMFQAAYNGHYAKYPSIDKVTQPGRDFNLYRPTGKGEFKNSFINISDYIDFNYSG